MEALQDHQEPQLDAAEQVEAETEKAMARREAMSELLQKHGSVLNILKASVRPIYPRDAL